MFNRFRIILAISLFFSLLAAPNLKQNTVQAQSGNENPQGWELQTFLTPDLLAQVENADTDLLGTLQKDGLQTTRDGDWLKISSLGGMDDLRKVLFESLGKSNLLIGNRADIVITMPFEDEQVLTIKVEANITTGYSWQFSGAEGITLTQEGEIQYQSLPDGPAKGTPQIATMVFKASGAGTGKLTLSYKRAFGPEEEPLTHLYLNLITNPGEIDLSDPRPITTNQVERTAGPFRSSANPISTLPIVGLPTSLDWRTQGIVPPIRDQGGCGSCWAFAAIGTMESAVAKGGGPITDLSEQFLISCNTDGYSCGGGNIEAQKYHVDQLAKNQTTIGAVLEADMPYSFTNGTCKVIANHPYKGMDWNYVTGDWWTTPTVTQLKNAIFTYGPVAVDVCVGQKFRDYQGGLFSTDESSTCGDGQINHAVVLVGWNDANETWILRNSWNTWWGDNGYMYIKWGISNIGLEASWVSYGNSAEIPGVPEAMTPSGDINTNLPHYTWSRVENASAYKLAVYDVAAAKYVVITTISDTSCSATTNKCTYTPSTALNYNKNYQWKVQATNLAGSSAYSSSVAFSPRAVLPPTPQAQTPSGNVTTTKPAYVWSRVSGAVTYKLAVYDVAAAKYVIITYVSSSYCSTTTNKCSYTPSTAISQYKDYTWKVNAINNANFSSPYSGPISFKSILPVPVTYTPSGSITTTKPTYIWSRISNASAYKLAVFDVSAAKYVIITTISSSFCSTTTNKCTYTPSTALTLNKDYKWKILATNATGSSFYSAFRSFKPFIPVPVTYTPTGSITATKPAYVWSRISGATYYKLAVFDVSAAKYVIITYMNSSSCSTTTNKCTLTPSFTLSQNKNYTWKVYAANTSGIGAYSASTSFEVISN